MDIYQKLISTIFLPVLLMLFLLHYYIVGQAVYGDGIYYFAYTHSLYKDHNLDFKNEFGHAYSPENNNALHELPLGKVIEKTKTGYVPNKYSVGAPLLWLPAFAIADMLTNFTNIFLKLQTSGYGNIYQISVGVLNVFFIILGIIVLFNALKKYFSPLISFLSITTILFGSNLLYYGSIDVINSHPSSFFVSSIFFNQWIETIIIRSVKRWFYLGCLIGLLILIRTQDVAFILLIIGEQLYFLKTKKYIPSIKSYVLFIMGLFLFLLPQMIIWLIIYGTFFHSPYISDKEGFNFLHPHIVGVLFNPKTGLFFWTPLFVISIFGLFVSISSKVKYIAYLSLLLIVSELYLISSWSGWTQGESFGMRMLISVVPFLTFGLALLYQNMLNKIKIKGLIIIGSFLIILNICLILYFMIFAKSLTYIFGQETHSSSLTKFEKLFHL